MQLPPTLTPSCVESFPVAAPMSGACTCAFACDALGVVDCEAVGAFECDTLGVIEGEFVGGVAVGAHDGDALAPMMGRQMATSVLHRPRPRGCRTRH